MSEFFAKLNDGRVFVLRGTDDEQEASQALTEHLEGKAEQQLSLWDAPSQVQVLHFDLGDVIEFSTAWADGDTSPASLERLAKIQMEHPYYPGPLGAHLAARVLSTRIADGKVYMRCERIPFPFGCVGDSDDDEEVA